MLDRHVLHRVLREALHHCIDGLARERRPQRPVAHGRDVAHAGKVREQRGFHRLRESDLELAQVPREQPGQALLGHEAALPDDADALADLLDLGQDVARQEQRGAFAHAIVEDVVDDLLVEGVEA